MPYKDLKKECMNKSRRKAYWRDPGKSRKRVRDYAGTHKEQRSVKQKSGMRKGGAIG